MGVQPTFENFDGNEFEAIGYVWSANFHRRHLNESQKPCALVKLEEQEKWANERLVVLQDEAKDWQGTRTDLGSNIPQRIGESGDPHARETDAIRAKEAGTNRQYIHDAEQLHRDHPEKFEEVLSGEKSIPHHRD